MQRVSEGAHELGVAHRLRSNGIHRPVKLFVAKCKQKCAYYVVERDPTHILAAVTDRPSEPETKCRKHRLQCATVFRQYHADAEVHYSNSSLSRRTRCCLPLLAHLGQKS